MSSGPKSSSRWGSFLQQAVAGVESRLDNILAEDEEGSKTTPKLQGDLLQPGISNTSSARTSGELSRQPSHAKQNDRLQERLAKAVVSRGGGARSDTSNPPSKAVTPIVTPSSPRTSTDGKPEDAVLPNGKLPEPDAEPSVVEPTIELEGVATNLNVEVASQPRSSLESLGHAERPLSTNPPSPTKLPSISALGHDEQNGTPSEELVRQLRSDYETSELRRQEEVHEYLEQIDALQAKLQYLTKEAVESAQKTAEEAGSGTAVQKLAKKDEQIALLMEEGQKLSQNELKLMTTIKKLRAKSVEDEKKSSLSKTAAEKAENAEAVALEKVRAAETTQAEESQRVMRLEKDLERTRADLSTRSTKIGELQSQLNQAKATVSTEDLIRTKRLLDEERSKISQLQEDISTLKIEKKLGEDRHRVQVKELEENADREKERARMADLELRGEIGVLESRLETYRAQAEEISSGSSSDTQAKLFRQIETLQSQYSVASENWRGIESSLLARIAGLEKDRDEIANKEVDLRRKNREASTKTRRAEEELEQASSKVYDIEEMLNKELAQSSALRTSMDEVQAELEAARAEVQASQDQIKTLHQEIERKDAQILSVPATPVESTSPNLGGTKNANDKSQTWGRRHPNSSIHGLKDLISHPDRPGTSRKSSHQIAQTHFSPARQDSVIFGSGRGSAAATPSVQTEHQDDLFNGVATPATPERTINEMFSASTAGAGPSVQLVERMSAAVRRLESEKAASKEEVERLQSQRDEAREQVVSLMRETDEKHQVDAKVAELEKEVTSLSQRYQTTLEMLGEKSERVEELQADIEDMKEIYKDTLEKSIR